MIIEPNENEDCQNDNLINQLRRMQDKDTRVSLRIPEAAAGLRNPRRLSFQVNEPAMTKGDDTIAANDDNDVDTSSNSSKVARSVAALEACIDAAENCQPLKDRRTGVRNKMLERKHTQTKEVGTGTDHEFILDKNAKSKETASRLDAVGLSDSVGIIGTVNHEIDSNNGPKTASTWGTASRLDAVGLSDSVGILGTVNDEIESNSGSETTSMWGTASDLESDSETETATSKTSATADRLEKCNQWQALRWMETAEMSETARRTATADTTETADSLETANREETDDRPEKRSSFLDELAIESAGNLLTIRRLSAAIRREFMNRPAKNTEQNLDKETSGQESAREQKASRDRQVAKTV